jgi:hypothetical protein
MSLVELLPIVRSLPRIEQLQLIQVLAGDLAKSEDAAPLVPGLAYPLWSPDHAYEAADTLMRELAAERTDR